MSLDIIININNNPLEKQFLKEHSFWYKYLNRSNKYYKDFITDMKKTYKLTTKDQINKALNNINMLTSLLEVIK